MKSSGGRRRECAAYSHSYLSWEIRVGEITVPVGVCTPIICLPVVFHGEEGGTREAYGNCLGMESLSGSPSSNTMWRRSECGRREGRAGEVGGRGGGGPFIGWRDSWPPAWSFVRDGSCAVGTLLDGVARVVNVADRGGLGGG